MTSNTSTTSSDSAASTQRLLGASLFRENLFKPFSGWLIVPLWIFILFFAIASFMGGVRKQEPPPIILAVLIFLSLMICIAGFFVVGPNESRAMVLFGHYRGTVRKVGFHWTNPFTLKKPVTLRVRTFETGAFETEAVEQMGKVIREATRSRHPVKVNDLDGNPIDIAAVVVWRVVDTAEALFAVQNYERYVEIQSESALRNLASRYHYDSPDVNGTSLRGSTDLVGAKLYVNKIALYRGQWGFKRGDMTEEQHEALIRDTAEPIFKRLKAQCKQESILRPAVVYGFFPCASQANDLVVYDPTDPDRELERFTFPRQTARQRMCISDFFRPANSGERDVVAFHCVTMGIEVSHRAKQLFERNEYTEYLYLHGMGVECAEALAELWHKRIRAELGIGNDDSPRLKELFTQKYRGSRYSFGYPACPEMSDQEKLFRLLKPERIGCHLSENWQIDPEQSTSAIIVHHPEAKYFAI